MLQNAEHMEEIYRPLSVPSVSDVLTAEKIVEIEQATVGQAENPLWHALRKGRITASNFYKVKTKVESLRKAETNAVSAKKLVASLIGEHTPPKDLPALKYGREMEAIAKAFYLEIFKKNHKGVKYRECGLFILACELALLFGRASRERASEGPRKGELATISHKFTFPPRNPGTLQSVKTVTANVPQIREVTTACVI